jgi:hypothetical protein
MCFKTHFFCCLLALYATLGFAAGLTENRCREFTARSPETIAELVNSVQNCISRADTSYPVFHGCIDWHSSVHGHWALLRAYRVLKDPRLLAQVTTAFTRKAMAEEYRYLQSNAWFEMPYGRAWFLLLMQEYETVTANSEYREISDYVAASLQAYLLNQPFTAEDPEYNNQPWAYRRLQEYYEFTQNQRELKSLTNKLQHATELSVSLQEDKNQGFFSMWGNLAHLLELVISRSSFKMWEAKNRPNPADLMPITKLYDAHQLSINYARAWAFWSLYRGTCNPHYLAAYIDHMEAGWRIHATHKNDYRRYGHWVPQFGIYALTTGRLDGSVQFCSLPPEF